MYYFHSKNKKNFQLLNISIYYKIMAGTLSEQDEAYPAFQLANQEGKMGLKWDSL